MNLSRTGDSMKLTVFFKKKEKNKTQLKLAKIKIQIRMNKRKMPGWKEQKSYQMQCKMKIIGKNKANENVTQKKSNHSHLLIECK